MPIRQNNIDNKADDQLLIMKYKIDANRQEYDDKMNPMTLNLIT